MTRTLRFFSTASALLAMVVAGAPSIEARELTFEERVEAHVAIERVYDSHRIGATLPFEQTVPRALVESKVRRYLAMSVALEQVWSTPITAEALRRESRRIAAHTRLPGRLREIYGALSDDPLLVQECFARPALVERLARRFFATDERIHGRDGPAVDWDAWWGETESRLAASPARTVAVGRGSPPEPAAVDPPCFPDDTWRHAAFDDLEERSAHTGIWTGTELLVWGGTSDSGLVDTGRRYDPLIDNWTAMAVSGAPTTRVRHTAVWTGSQMVVWGGWDGAGSNTGGRYDPVSDTWTAISTVGVPAARENHTAVWTGGEMIVWGGRNAGLLSSGGRYDPLNDSWTPTSSAGAPSARQGHTMVWTGSRMVVWGGSDGSVAGTGGRYNPQNDSWTTTSAAGAPDARTAHTAVWAGNRMLIWGGRDDAATELDTGARFNPNNNSWTPMANVGAPEARSAHSATWTGTVMIVWGGIGDGYLDTGGRYDPGSDSWSPTAVDNAPLARFGHTAVWTGSHMVAWGGSFFHRLSSGGRYDPVADAWTPTAPGAPESRSGHTALWTGTEMLIWGGSSTNLGFDNSGARYDPLLDAWAPTSTTDAPRPRSGHTAVWTGRHMIVWGGTVDEPAENDTGGRYDSLTDTWAPTSTGDAPSGRHFHTAVWTGDAMIVWGGFPDLGTGGRYDPVADVWTPTSSENAPTGRYWHTAVWSGSRMLVWGGYREPTFLPNGSRYDPANDTWSPISSSGAPEGRALHTAVWSGDEMIVWGGNNLTFAGTGTRFDTGGVYHPVTDVWAATPSVGAPTGRDGHSAIWNGSEMVVWGGQVGPPFTPNDVDTGGRLDLTAGLWLGTSADDPPSARRDHTAVWTGSDMLVWGGLAGPFGGPNDYPEDWGQFALGHGTDDDGDAFSECAGDCDDADATVYPGAPELCDNRDNDCDGAAAPDEADGDGDGSPFCADCDDADPDSYPGAPELCDALDNDCDSVEDEFVSVCGLGQCESTGWCSAGVDTCVPGTPSSEICDGIDNDCDGSVPPDELDDDGDGSSDCEGDCDDADARTYAGAIEANDGQDNQCPGDTGFGLIDEISGTAGFTNPGDRDAFCWPSQPLAGDYEASRSGAPDQPVNCLREYTFRTCWIDESVPLPGDVFFYLVRAFCPYTGSLGADSTGDEHVWGCEDPFPPVCPD